MPRSHRLRPTFRMIVTVAALAATVPVVSATAETIPGVTCSKKGASGTAGKSWQTFNAPTFLPPQGLAAPPQEITAYAVAPSNPKLIAVTNGNSIQISRDGGCGWQQSIRLDQVPSNPNVALSGQFTKIRGLYIAPKSNRIVALAEEGDTGASVGRPHVLLNDDASPSGWRLGDSGLPPVGEPLTVKAHPNAPNVMYLSFRSAKAPEGGPVQCPPAPLPCPGGSDNGTPGLLWGSSDGGQTWSRRTDPNDLNGAGTIRHFSIEDDDPSGRTLWVVSNGQLRRSENGGASFSVPDGLNQAGFEFTAVESINKTSKTNPVRLLAFSAGGEMMRLEDGQGWVRSRVPFSSVESVSQRPSDGDIVVATSPASGNVTVWRIYGYQFRDFEFGDKDSPQYFKATYGWQSITPNGVTVAAKVSSASDGGTSTYFLRDRQRILRFLGTRITNEIIDANVPPGERPPAPAGNLSPSNVTVPIAMGKTADVEYTLTLPPSPTPVDLFLLVDNSGSMQPLIDELKRSLGDVIGNLVRAKIEVRVGVGQINVQPDRQELPLDDPNTEWDESKPRPVYQLLRKIGPIEGVGAALSKIDGRGGSGDEAQLEALYQAATGEGYDPLGLGGVAGSNVPEGQDAGWTTTKDVVKVIVHATDEPFSDNIRGGHNTPGPVADALNNLGIRQIGLSQGVDEAHEDLQDMARRTGALAPAGGTDCDGNGRVDGDDPRAGEPLVCEQNYGLDKTLANLIKSLQDPQDISVDISKGPTFKTVTQSSFRVNAKILNTRKFTVTFACIGVAPGSYEHTIKAGLRGIKVATAVATVNCGNVPVRPQRPETGSNPIQQPPPVQPQPVPAPIAPVQPVPQPQTQVQGQPQVNPQAGAAEQKQRQIQVALAENDLGPQDEDQLAMVGLESGERAVAPATAVVIAGMAMASACAGVVFARRRRTQVARAWID